jgi:hypothetical protein
MLMQGDRCVFVTRAVFELLGLSPNDPEQMTKFLNQAVAPAPVLMRTLGKDVVGMTLEGFRGTKVMMHREISDCRAAEKVKELFTVFLPDEQRPQSQ